MDFILDCKKVLTPRQFQMMYMRYVKEMTYTNIADHFGISPGAARQNCAKALVKCKRKFHNEAFNEIFS